MQVVFTESAKEYIKERKLEYIYIWPEFSRRMFFGLQNIRIEIRDKQKDNRFFVRDYFDGIHTNYDPTINFFKRSELEIRITAFGFGKFKKLVTTTEFSSINLDM